ncbi:predicted protein [Nematostella vectensis]|uniref:Uncharacterized protein n=1 Tax=Nematostella vectensis TaxID=45351 RepID=A7SA45_NEMVE|nr:balbiani ring protein 3 [Nematostella vectensis]EDO39428.1 predicted protein [Nematostella vectensis]|eukprot:XP_001631491.1 predicted protein [Nematostella vectensis]
MKMFKIVLLLIAPLFCNSLDYNDAELCKPHLTVVPIDPPNYGYYPYFIKLHRCGGSCDITQPNVRECVALETERVKVGVIAISGVPRDTIMAVNHTKCGCQCVAKPSDCDPEVQVWEPNNCLCKCRYADTQPKKCPEGHRWSASSCSCMCDKAPEVCPVGKYWSQRSCGCVCSAHVVGACNQHGKVTNSDCECVDQSDISVNAFRGKQPSDDAKSGRLMLILMVAEFGVLVLVFDAIMYRKKAGFTYFLVRRISCKAKSKDMCHSTMTVDTACSTDKSDHRDPVDHV